MLLPDHSYVKVDSLKECLRLLRETGDRAQVVAGGTDVIFNMRQKLFEPDLAVSIRGLEDLKQIEELPDGSVRIGAGCRLADLSAHSRVGQRYPALAKAIDAVASTHIRNMGTLGGNICLKTRCWYTNNSEQWREGITDCFKTEGDLCHVIKSSTKCHAINNADTPLALMVLNAVLTLENQDGSRQVAIRDFYQDDGMNHTVLQADELVTCITLPPPKGLATFIKIAPRQGMDFSLGAVAASCDSTTGNVGPVSIILGSLTSFPIQLREPARIVSEKGFTDEAISEALGHVRAELGFVTNLYGRAMYKKHLANVLVKRVLEELRDM